MSGEFEFATGASLVTKPPPSSSPEIFLRSPLSCHSPHYDRSEEEGTKREQVELSPGLISLDQRLRFEAQFGRGGQAGREGGNGFQTLIDNKPSSGVFVTCPAATVCV